MALPDGYSIRLYKASDETALNAITLAAIRAIGTRRYSEAQVEAWAYRHPGPERFVERAERGHQIFIAADADDKPIAYALLEPDGHLDMLYCHPDHTRRGFAEQLLKRAETHAREAGLARLYTEASELARQKFERAGYTVTARLDFEIEGPNGAVPIHNYAMETVLP